MNLHLVRTLSRILSWAVFSVATSAIAQDLPVNGNFSVTGEGTGSHEGARSADSTEAKDSPSSLSSPSTVTTENKQLSALVDKVRMEGLKLNSPMGLYAKIIDQYDKPVAGIPVEVTYRYFNNVVRTSWESHEATEKIVSDHFGQFGYSGISGVYLSLYPIPTTGIKISPPRCGEGFDRSSDGKPKSIIYSKQNPFVFRAWRMGPAGALKEGYIRGFPEPTNEKYGIDFASNKIVKQAGGDIEIQIKRESNKPPGYLGPWSFKMRKGRVQFHQVTDAEDPFRFTAPADGYQSEFSVAFEKDSDFVPDALYHFWIFDGRYYGVMDVHIKPFQKNVSRISISYRQSIIEGDRNLQPVE